MGTALEHAKALGLEGIRDGDLSAVDRCTGGEYNPHVGDGLEGFGAFLATLSAQNIQMKYSKLHLLVGDGNFVATLCEATIGEHETAVIDLFHLANGKIVDHWDATESIQARTDWVSLGKF